MSLFLYEASRFREVKEFAQSKQGSQDMSSESLNPKLMPAPLSQASCISGFPSRTSGWMLNAQ